MPRESAVSLRGHVNRGVQANRKGLEKRQLNYLRTKLGVCVCVVRVCVCVCVCVHACVTHAEACLCGVWSMERALVGTILCSCRLCPYRVTSVQETEGGD